MLKRKLAGELRKLRQVTGLSIDAVAELTGVPRSSISRAEQGTTTPSIDALLKLLDVYQASPEKVEELVELARQSAKRGWLRSTFGDVSVPDWFVAYVSLEAEASQIRIYSVLIPGLFQTYDYAKELVSFGGGLSEDEVNQQVSLRMARQDLLYGSDAPKVHAIVDEAAIRRRVGNIKVMRDQMTRLVAAATEPNVTLQILPFEHGAATAAIGSAFSILDFFDDPPVVYLENYRRGHYVEDPETVRVYQDLFGVLTRHALDAPASNGMIAGSVT